MSAALEKAKAENPCGTRDLAMIDMWLGCGLRHVGFSALEVEDVQNRAQGH